MTIQINENYFSLLYSKAMQGYLSCINNKENELLKKEVGVTLESIQVEEKNIKIVLSKNYEHDYRFEVTLALSLSPEKSEIGRYTYAEDIKGEYIDEFLVFY